LKGQHCPFQWDRTELEAGHAAHAVRHKCLTASALSNLRQADWKKLAIISEISVHEGNIDMAEK